MRKRRISHRSFYKWIFFALSTFSFTASAQGPLKNLVPVSRANLCVTEGTIEERATGEMSVNVPKMRAYVNETTPQLVEVQFTYLGSTENETRLGSGELRRQFGLKLRAEDACNLVYAMWRIEPESRMVVSVKTNPGQHTSAECGNRGYRNVKPAHSAPVPILHPGESHVLRAAMTGSRMQVFVDGSLVWDGDVGSDVLGFNGPVGMRSDNARLQMQFRAGQPVTASPPSSGCRATGEE
jgi:hypothetical protein